MKIKVASWTVNKDVVTYFNFTLGLAWPHLWSTVKHKNNWLKSFCQNFGLALICVGSDKNKAHLKKKIKDRGDLKCQQRNCSIDLVIQN